MNGNVTYSNKFDVNRLLLISHEPLIIHQCYCIEQISIDLQLKIYLQVQCTNLFLFLVSDFINRIADNCRLSPVYDVSLFACSCQAHFSEPWTSYILVQILVPCEIFINNFCHCTILQFITEFAYCCRNVAPANFIMVSSCEK